MARLVRGDVITTTSFLARRVSKSTLKEDRRLKHMLQNIWHHLDFVLVHSLHPDDRPYVVIHHSHDAEFGGDALMTKTMGGFWLELRSN